jgi:hypothetical protein
MKWYFVDRIHVDFLAVKVEVRAEVLLGGGVEESGFERSGIGVPIDEDHLLDIHVVVVGEAEVEDSEAEFLGGEMLDEIFPFLIFVADCIQHLHQRALTTCSLSILKTR